MFKFDDLKVNSWNDRMTTKVLSPRPRIKCCETNKDDVITYKPHIFVCLWLGLHSKNPRHPDYVPMLVMVKLKKTVMYVNVMMMKVKGMKKIMTVTLCSNCKTISSCNSCNFSLVNWPGDSIKYVCICPNSTGGHSQGSSIHWLSSILMLILKTSLGLGKKRYFLLISSSLQYHMPTKMASVRDHALCHAQ